MTCLVFDQNKKSETIAIVQVRRRSIYRTRARDTVQVVMHDAYERGKDCEVCNRQKVTSVDKKHTPPATISAPSPSLTSPPSPGTSHRKDQCVFCPLYFLFYLLFAIEFTGSKRIIFISPINAGFKPHFAP